MINYNKLIIYTVYTIINCLVNHFYFQTVQLTSISWSCSYMYFSIKWMRVVL